MTCLMFAGRSSAVTGLSGYRWGLRRLFRVLVTINVTAATQTMDGPAGVSSTKAARRPIIADSIPIKPAAMAIPSGVRDKGRAAAAGMINIAAMSNTPTTLMATATVMAREIVNASCSRFGLIPFA